jgi:hypothetical protein
MGERPMKLTPFEAYLSFSTQTSFPHLPIRLLHAQLALMVACQNDPFTGSSMSLTCETTKHVGSITMETPSSVYQGTSMKPRRGLRQG